MIGESSAAQRSLHHLEPAVYSYLPTGKEKKGRLADPVVYCIFDYLYMYAQANLLEIQYCKWVFI